MSDPSPHVTRWITRLKNAEKSGINVDTSHSTVLTDALRWLADNPLPKFGQVHDLKGKRTIVDQAKGLEGIPLANLPENPLISLRLCLHNWNKYGIGIRVLGSIQSPASHTVIQTNPPPMSPSLTRDGAIEFQREAKDAYYRGVGV